MGIDLQGNKSHYEILGVAPHVGTGQIQAAYRFARSLYTGESTPTHGFLDQDERARMLTRVEEAYAALSNPNSRRDYDALLSGPEASPSVAENPRRDPRPRPVSRALPLSSPPLAAPGTEAPTDLIRIPEVVNGAALKALRESRNLSIDQIAALSKVGGRFLKALEEDRHEALPGRVFARGFLIEYARAIHAPEAELVERYLRHWKSK